MGTLIAMHYPTDLFADQADHAYVKCGTGAKAWGCWGGKTGGSELRRGEGSTRRADAIAGANERAGITCYLVNGVCHQAANRILLPALVTVRGVRGYHISEALFGTYGRLLIWPCRAPFDQHPEINGDLPECSEPDKVSVGTGILKLSAVERKIEQKYLQGVLALYGGPTGQAVRMLKQVKIADVENHHMNLFLLMADFKLKSDLTENIRKKLGSVRKNTERLISKMEESYSNNDMPIHDYITEFNRETINFQNSLANTLKPEHYRKLLDMEPGDTVILADRKIIKEVYNVEF